MIISIIKCVIAKSDYHKRIIRFPRLEKPCDKEGVSGTKPVARTEIEIQIEEAEYEYIT